MIVADAYINATLTVQKRLSVIGGISGQNRGWGLIYPKVSVYPRGLCTPNGGSFGGP